MLGHTPDLRKAWETAAKVPGALVVDAKSVYDAASKGDTASSLFSMKEKYAALELMAVVESIGLMNTSLLWVSSEAQLADGLTKSQAQDYIRGFLQGLQMWTVKYDPDFVAAKKKKEKKKRLEHREDASAASCTAVLTAASERDFWGM
ncbi:GIP [Symbiodinium necroappetens]|uniref:GIP protein n=1 Tax=Symbiodinium necroappetens TaxID=1628268 RepID=A0A812KNI1_9DINO|nr:GIP [Symbiodinium necroappetens]